MHLPEDLRAALEAVRTVGTPRLVGGCVRDWLLGIQPKDFDIEVAGVDFETLRRRLSKLGPTNLVGRSFGVLKLRLGSAEYDFSLPRRESKTGSGHRGFAVEPDPGLSVEDAAARRDFTLNAIAWDPFSGQLLDPLQGERDLRSRILRHAGSGFADDPLRVLRAFQFAARFDLTLASETAELCRRISGSFGELARERVWLEWEKWSVKSVRPSRGLAVLEETGWLGHFPELAALKGCPQEPEWHPEGDVLAHTRHCLDALVNLEAWQLGQTARKRILSFAVLTHDFGKPATTKQLERRGKMRWTSFGHEAAGVAPAESFLERIGAPLEIAPTVSPLVRNHLAHHHSRDGLYTDTQVRRLARRVEPATIDDLCTVMIADSRGRPPLHSPDTLAYIERLRRRARELELQFQSPRPLLQGRHLVALGMRPGPEFKTVLDAAFDAQLDGMFRDEQAGMAWLQNHLRHRYPNLR